ncbi:reverse transcriptase [Gossypium australe]|uniref:Reverse transcriptase n=1 Tax=Gossypium australe TaxID=47621 RepID=A0A5B6W6X5_9ROSI|nr:reverse transcriptase [Gossypium australe]
MVFFMETKIDGKHMEKIRRRCGFVNGIIVGVEGSRGGICLVWRKEITVSLKTFSKNHIDVLIEENNVNGEWRFTRFYGSPYVSNQSASWNLLRTLGQEQRYPWLVSGDFNEIMYSFENSGCQPREEKRMAAFREVLDECQLMDMGFKGASFTWERRNIPETNIKERLDGGITNEKWMHLFPKGNIHHLIRSISDHCPLLISTNNGTIYKQSPRFKFEAWESSNGSISEKLERLQASLTRWASSINKDRDGLKGKLTKELGNLMESERDDDIMAKLIDTRIKLNMEIDKDEILFHKHASARRRINTINRLESVEGQEISDELEINEAALNYFQNLFSSNGVGNLSHLLTGIGTNISSEINTALLATYTAKEVYLALKGMGPTKAPGCDSFPVLFFQRFCHTVGKYVEAFCLRILNEGKDFEPLNSTNIVLIPKIPNPTSLINFRPISLCIVLYKIMEKTIANRLQDCIGRYIDSAQSAFVPGRLISDNVLIAYETPKTYWEKRIYGNKARYEQSL